MPTQAEISHLCDAQLEIYRGANARMDDGACELLHAQISAYAVFLFEQGEVPSVREGAVKVAVAALELAKDIHA